MFKTTLLASALGIGLLAVPATQAAVYQWRDASGVVNYGEACPSDAQCKRVKGLEGNRAVPSATRTVTPAGGSSAAPTTAVSSRIKGTSSTDTSGTGSTSTSGSSSGSAGGGGGGGGGSGGGAASASRPSGKRTDSTTTTTDSTSTTTSSTSSTSTTTTTTSSTPTTTSTSSTSTTTTTSSTPTTTTTTSTSGTTAGGTCNPTASGLLSVTAVASRTTGVAPLAVFFEAVAQSSVTRPFHDIAYGWKFGDSSAPWAYGSQVGGPGINDKNVAAGPVAAHVFEQPGVYTVCLTAFDGKEMAETAVQITVTDFAASNTVCIANGAAPTPGVDAGCPAGATAVGNMTSWPTVVSTYLSGTKGTNKKILLKRGDVLNTGLNEGQEWLGTFQLATHVEFTVLGDTINHAARLSDFARFGSVWATKNLIGKLTAAERQMLKYGVRRTTSEGQNLFVASTYSTVASLTDLVSGGSEKLKDIAALPITEIMDIQDSGAG